MLCLVAQLTGTSKIKVLRPLNPECSYFASFSIKAKYSLRQNRAILSSFFHRDYLQLLCPKNYTVNTVRCTAAKTSDALLTEMVQIPWKIYHWKHNNDERFITKEANGSPSIYK